MAEEVRLDYMIKGSELILTRAGSMGDTARKGLEGVRVQVSAVAEFLWF